MKIRTDFVTNSSSSSFTLMIRFDLADGTSVQFDAQGGTGETGRVDYFDNDAIVKVSPKQLGNAKNVDELIQLLEDGVVDGWDETKIFDKSRSVISDCYDEEYDAYDFISEIRENIKSMDQIESITIEGDEQNYENYYRCYTYNLKTKEYTGVVEGCDFEKDGSSGGDLRFSDLYSCKVQGDSDENEQEQNAQSVVPAVTNVNSAQENSISASIDMRRAGLYDSYVRYINSQANKSADDCHDWTQDYPMTKPIEGTAYAGRVDRIEYVKEGDELLLKADHNSPYYSPVAIEIFNLSDESLGFIAEGFGCESLTEIASHIDVLKAKVASVTPLSKRSKRAKHALMDVELYL